MSFFGNSFIDEIVARIFYDADIYTRGELINQYNFLEVNERERVSVFCGELRRRIGRNLFIRSLSIQAHARDTTRRDALFVFRNKNIIKIGLLEAKLLRINDANLSDKWDWYKSNTNLSHFTEQINNQQVWNNVAAVWDMFIPNCQIGLYSPSLESQGSSNIWAADLFLHPNIKKPNKLWNYKHVLDATKQYLSMYSIIKEILKCHKGIMIDIPEQNKLIIKSTSNIEMEIPIPNNGGKIFNKVQEFFKENKNLASYNYYRFDDIVESVKDYEKTREIILPKKIIHDKRYNERAILEYKEIVSLAIKASQT